MYYEPTLMTFFAMPIVIAILLVAPNLKGWFIALLVFNYCDMYTGIKAILPLSGVELLQQAQLRKFAFEDDNE